jgi:hypothetical protein
MTEPNSDIPESEHGRKIGVRMLVTPQPELLNEIAQMHWEDPGDYPRWCMPCQTSKNSRDFSSAQLTQKIKKHRCRECENNGS